MLAVAAENCGPGSPGRQHREAGGPAATPLIAAIMQCMPRRNSRLISSARTACDAADWTQTAHQQRCTNMAEAVAAELALHYHPSVVHDQRQM